MADHSKFREQIVQIVKNARSPDAATAALSILFPRAKEVLGTEVLDTIESSQGRYARRISERDFSRQYFRLTPDAADLGKSQINAMFGSGAAEAFTEFSIRLDAAPEAERPRLQRLLLEMLEGKLTELGGEIRDWFIGIFNNAHTLLREDGWNKGDLFGSSPTDVLRAMLSKAMTNLDQRERVDLLKQAIHDATDISLVCELVRAVTGDTEPQGAEFKQASLGDGTDEVRTLLLERIRRMSADGSLLEQAKLRDILWFWWGTGNGDEVLEFTGRMLDSTAGIERLLEMPITYVMSSAGNYEKVDHKAWNKIVDLQRLHAHAVTRQTSSSAPQRGIAERFLQAYERGRNSTY